MRMIGGGWQRFEICFIRTGNTLIPLCILGTSQLCRQEKLLVLDGEDFYEDTVG